MNAMTATSTTATAPNPTNILCLLAALIFSPPSELDICGPPFIALNYRSVHKKLVTPELERA
jgi:hypothetical protein